MLLLIQYTLIFASVLMLVALGGCFSEHSGVINLGLEGIMCIGALGGALMMRYLPSGMPSALMVLIVILGAVAFYEVKDDSVRLIRINEQYYRMMDMAYVMSDSEYATHLRQLIHPEDRAAFLDMFRQADENGIKGATADLRYMKDGRDTHMIRFRIYPLEQKDGSRDTRLYYGHIPGDLLIFYRNLAEQVEHKAAEGIKILLREFRAY